MSKITPCLWFDGQAEEAAQFYTRLFPDSRIDSVSRSASDTPSPAVDRCASSKGGTRAAGRLWCSSTAGAAPF